MAKKKQWHAPEEGTEVSVDTKEAAAPEVDTGKHEPTVVTVPMKTMSVYPNALQARKITAIGPLDPATSSRKLTLADHTDVVANAATLSGYNPTVGDYYVVPDEGNSWCMVKSTFAVTYKAAF